MDYTLPDSRMTDQEGDSWKVWVPDSTCIVIGKSNEPGESLELENIDRDGLTVLRRPSGGQAVVLTPGTPVVSITKEKASESLNCMGYFKEFSLSLIEALQPLLKDELSIKGTSDIAVGKMKISGSSIYQNRNHVFYHAVINVEESPDLFSRYLKHPPREPEYRKKRDHKEFVTSMKALNPDITTTQVVEQLNNYFQGQSLKR